MEQLPQHAVHRHTSADAGLGTAEGRDVPDAPTGHSHEVGLKHLRQRSSLRVLVIDGHPRADSFGASLADTISRAAGSRAKECRLIRLRDLDFDPCAQGQALDADLQDAQRDLVWAEIIVWVHPTWWGGAPALLKGFLDRILHPGFAFVERSGGGWEGLLGGRSSLLVTTMDTPGWIYRWLIGAPGHRAMRDATLGFCGIAPTRIVSFGPVKTSTLLERRQWLARAAREGRGLEKTFRTGWRVRLGAWVTASRLHFYVQPWLAYTLGALALTAGSSAEWRWPAYLIGYASIWLIEFITVTTNELEDFGSDRANRNSSKLTGGSRVLVSGRLSGSDLHRGRLMAGALLIGVWLAGLLMIPDTATLTLVGMFGLALGLAYSMPPVRLSARGLGEVDVAVTHSFLVVLMGFLSQGGALFSATPWMIALPLSVAVLPSIILAGFPDFEADESTGKRTLAVRLGRQRAAVIAGVCALCASLLPLCVTGPGRSWIWWTAIPAIPHAMGLAAMLRRYASAGYPPGRIDSLLVVGLTFMVWFCVVPLGVLLLVRR